MSGTVGGGWTDFSRVHDGSGKGCHTLEAGRSASSLGSSGTSAGGGGVRRASFCASRASLGSSRASISGRRALAREEVRAVAGLLAVGVLLAVGRRAVTLGTVRDAVVRGVGLAIAWAGHLVAGGDAAAVGGIACTELDRLRHLTRAGLHLLAHLACGPRVTAALSDEVVSVAAAARAARAEMARRLNFMVGISRMKWKT